MPASLSMRKKHVAGDFLKRTAGLVTGAVGSYIEDAMPVTSSIASDAAKIATSAASRVKATNRRSVNLHIRNIKINEHMKGIFDWYMGKDDMFSQFDDMDFENFDVDLPDDNTDAEAKFKELEDASADRRANQVSSVMIETTQKQVESQIVMTAEIKSSIETQTATIQAGFDRTNETLNKILEVITTNTATLIETTAAGFSSQSANDKMLASGKFNLKDYLNMAKQNANTGMLGMMSAFAPMLKDKTMRQQMFGPDFFVQMFLESFLNKKAPNLKTNMKALDNAVNNTIMSALIRLGESSGFGRKLGLRADRKEFGPTVKDKFEVKQVAFDSITREAIVNTIPGYLKDILNALSGKDKVYDYRVRRFRSQEDIDDEFKERIRPSGTLHRASRGVRQTFGNDDFGNMTYDMLMASLGSKTRTKFGDNTAEYRQLINSFSQGDNLKKYMENLITQQGVEFTADMGKRLDIIANNLKTRGMTSVEMGNQVVQENLRRNRDAQEAINNAKMYNVDFKSKTSLEDELKRILEENGYKTKNTQPGNGGPGPEIRENVNGTNRSGINYTNTALYEIYRLLNRGINVYQVGRGRSQTRPYDDYIAQNYLVPPGTYKPKTQTRTMSPGQIDTSDGLKLTNDAEGSQNLLRNNQLEDGTMEQLTTGQRLGRWGKSRGGALAKAVMSGKSDEVVAAFSDIVKDVTEVTGDGLKKAARKVNDSFGNVTGFLNHKLFGKEYEYKNDKGETVHVKANEKGGIFGFVGDYFKDMFKGTKERAGNWWKTVSGYFKFPSDGEEGGDQTAQKRKQIIGASIGAMAGAGILGGPLGLVMGAVAGNALSAANIGGKIKEMLFGRDRKGHAKGVVTRLVDGVVDPIKYQVGKTFNKFGDILKKNILGPLSDIGQAIKDRATSAASSTFGKVFKVIGGVLLAPFKVATKMAKAPITILGNLVRGTAGAAGGVVGAGLSGIANIIAHGKEHVEIDPETGERIVTSSRENLKYRRRARNRKIGDDHDTRFDSYDEWRRQQEARREEWGRKYGKYTEENSFIVQEHTADNTEHTDQNTSEIRDETRRGNEQREESNRIQDETREAVQNLNRLGSEQGSIFTHDQGIHDRLDQIIDILTSVFSTKKVGTNTSQEYSLPMPTDSNDSQLSLPGPGVMLALPGPVSSDSSSTTFMPPAPVATSQRALAVQRRDAKYDAKITDNQDESDDYSNSAIAAASVLVTEGEITTEDQRLANQIFEEAEKDDSNSAVVHEKLRELLQIQKEKTEENNEGDFWNKLFDLLKKGLLPLAALLAAIIEWLKNRGNDDSNPTNGGNLSDAMQQIADAATSDDPTLNGINAVANLFDWEFQSKWDVPNPLGIVYHNDPDAAGEPIVNAYATHAKSNYQLGGPLKQSISASIRDYILAHFFGNNVYTYVPGTTATSPEVSGYIPYGSTTTNPALGIGMDDVSQAQLAGTTQAQLTGPTTTTDWVYGSTELTPEGYYDTNGSTIVDVVPDEATYGTYDTYTNEAYSAGQGTGEPNQAGWNGSSGPDQSGSTVDAEGWYEIDTGNEEQAAQYKQQADERNRSTASGLARNVVDAYGRMGIMHAGSSVMGEVVSDVAQKFGVDESTAEEYGNIGQAITAAGLSANQMIADYRKFRGKSKGTTSILDAALNAIKKLFNFLADTFSSFDFLRSHFDDLLGQLDDIYAATVGKLTDKIAAKIVQLMGKEATEATVKAAAGLVGAGVGAVIGAVHGATSAANLFRVRNDEVDGLMEAVSTCINAVWSALEWIPGVGYAWAIVEILDASIMQGIVGTSLKQYLAFFLYNLLKGDNGETLEAAQGNFNAAREAYNEKWGINLNEQTFADMTENTGLIDTIWRGKAQYDENGELVTDEGGARLNTGLSQYVFGNESKYMKDKEGNLIKDKEGRNIKQVDLYGNTIKENEKWGDKVKRGLSAAKMFFRGGDVYDTDKNGVAKVDSNGEYLVLEHQESLGKRIWNRITGKGNGIADMDWKEGLVLDDDGNPVIYTDENGEPVLDENGNEMYVNEEGEPITQAQINKEKKMIKKAQKQPVRKGLAGVWDYITGKNRGGKQEVQINANGNPVPYLIEDPDSGQLVQMTDDNGNPMYTDQNGQPMLLKGDTKIVKNKKKMTLKEDGTPLGVFDENGEQKTDENGNLLYYDKDFNEVVYNPEEKSWLEEKTDSAKSWLKKTGKKAKKTVSKVKKWFGEVTGLNPTAEEIAEKKKANNVHEQEFADEPQKEEKGWFAKFVDKLTGKDEEDENLTPEAKAAKKKIEKDAKEYRIETGKEKSWWQKAGDAIGGFFGLNVDTSAEGRGVEGAEIGGTKKAAKKEVKKRLNKIANKEIQNIADTAANVMIDDWGNPVPYRIEENGELVDQLDDEGFLLYLDVDGQPMKFDPDEETTKARKKEIKKKNKKKVRKKVEEGQGGPTEDQADAEIEEEEKKEEKKDNKGGVIGKIGGWLNRFFGFSITADAAELDDEELTDEEGEKIKDKDNNSVKLANLPDFIDSAKGMLTKVVLGPISPIIALFKSFNANKYVTDENGEPLKDADGNPIVQDNLGAFLKGMGSDVFQALFGDIINMGKIAKGWIDDKVPWLGEGMDNIGDFINDKLVKPIGDFVDGIKGFIKDYAPWSKEGRENIGDWVGEKVGDAFNAITKPFKNLGKSVKDWLDNHLPWKKEGEDGSFAGWIGEKFSNGINAILSPFKNIKEKINTWLDEHAPWRKDAEVGDSESMPEWIAKHGKDAFNSFLKPVIDFKDKISDWIQEHSIWKEDEKVESMPEWLAIKGKDAYNSFVQPVLEMKDKLLDWINSHGPWAGVEGGIAGWLGSKAEGLYDKFVQPVIDLKDSIATWIKDHSPWKDSDNAGSWVSDKLGDIFDKITSPFTSIINAVSSFISKIKEIVDAWNNADGWGAKIDVLKSALSSFTGGSGGATDDPYAPPVNGPESHGGTGGPVDNPYVPPLSSPGSRPISNIKPAPIPGKPFKNVRSITSRATDGIDSRLGVGGPISLPTRVRNLTAVGDIIEPSVMSGKVKKKKKKDKGKNKNGTDSSTTTTTTTEDAVTDTTTDDITDTTETTDDTSTSTVQEGGNPLNKAYKVTSPFGPRSYPHSGYHYGVDLVPSDGSGQAQVGSRFHGKVSNIVSNIPDTDHAVQSGGSWTYNGANSGGNQVWIDTDKGWRIKNMHLKHGSIPSNITVGATVNVGQKVGDMGTTGWSTGPHLHYQMESNTTGGNSAAFNPIDSVKSGTQIDNFTETGITSDGTQTDADPSVYDSETKSAETGTEEGVISQLLGKVQEVGKGFLSLITGGLTDSALSSASSEAAAFADLLSGDNSGPSLQKFLDMCQAEVGTKENPMGSNNVKYNTWYYGHAVSGAAYPWCMAFVQWCFNNAGLTLPYKTASCAALLSWYKQHEPDKVHDTPEAGDIVIWGGSGHTGIVKEVHSSNSYTTIEGNSSNQVCNREKNLSNVAGFIRAVDWSKIDNAANASVGAIDSSDIGSIWQYFINMGYSDIMISGILGCWKAESNIQPKRLEWDYLSGFQTYLGGDYDRAATDRATMDSYTQWGWTQYKNGCNTGGYKGPDGHLYPGYGLAQWTGPRGYNLLKLADQKGMKWYDIRLQMEMLHNESNDSSCWVHGWESKVRAAGSPSEAASLFCKWFEGWGGDKGARPQYAEELYAQYHGKYSQGSNSSSSDQSSISESIFGTGGPTEEDEELAQLEANGMGGPVAPYIEPLSQAQIARSQSEDLLHQNIPVLHNGISSIPGGVSLPAAMLHRESGIGYNINGTGGPTEEEVEELPDLSAALRMKPTSDSHVKKGPQTGRPSNPDINTGVAPNTTPTTFKPPTVGDMMLPSLGNDVMASTRTTSDMMFPGLDDNIIGLLPDEFKRERMKGTKPLEGWVDPTTIPIEEDTGSDEYVRGMASQAIEEELERNGYIDPEEYKKQKADANKARKESWKKQSDERQAKRDANWEKNSTSKKKSDKKAEEDAKKAEEEQKKQRKNKALAVLFQKDKKQFAKIYPKLYSDGKLTKKEKERFDKLMGHIKTSAQGAFGEEKGNKKIVAMLRQGNKKVAKNYKPAKGEIGKNLTEDEKKRIADLQKKLYKPGPHEERSNRQHYVERRTSSGGVYKITEDQARREESSKAEAEIRKIREGAKNRLKKGFMSKTAGKQEMQLYLPKKEGKVGENNDPRAKTGGTNTDPGYAADMKNVKSQYVKLGEQLYNPEALSAEQLQYDKTHYQTYTDADGNTKRMTIYDYKMQQNTGINKKRASLKVQYSKLADQQNAWVRQQGTIQQQAAAKKKQKAEIEKDKYIPENVGGTLKDLDNNLLAALQGKSTSTSTSKTTAGKTTAGKTTGKTTQSTVKPKTATTNTTEGVGGDTSDGKLHITSPITTARSTQPTYTVPNFSSLVKTVTTGNNAESQNFELVLQALDSILNMLSRIYGEESTGNDLLNSINQKDFTAGYKTVSNSFKALGNAGAKKKYNTGNTSKSTARSVSNMARP